MREVQLSEIARCKSKDSKLVGQIFLSFKESLQTIIRPVKNLNGQS